MNSLKRFLVVLVAASLMPAGVSLARNVVQLKARFALKASNNLYLSAMGGGKGPVLVHGASIQDWEEFSTFENGSFSDMTVIHILSHDGHFLVADPHGDQVTATGTVPSATGSSDAFVLVKGGSGSGSIATGDTVYVLSLGANRWLTGIPSQDGPVDIDRNIAQRWEAFEIVVL